MISTSPVRDKYEVKQEVAKELNEIMANVKEEVDDNFLQTTIMKLLLRYNVPEIQKQEILTEIIYDIKGYGILQPY